MPLAALSPTIVNVLLGTATFVLLLAVAFFSLAEIALFALNRIRLDFLVRQNTPRAALVQKIVREPDELLSAILIFNTLAITAAPILASLLLMSFMAEYTAGIVASLGMTVATLFVGEILPKVLASQFPEKISLRIAPFMTAMMAVARPFVWIVVKITDAVLALFGIKVQHRIPSVTREELRHMVGVSGEAGHLDTAERDLLQKVLAFRDKTARDVMVPREKIDALDIGLSQHDVIVHMADHSFTRVPVFEGELDRIRGILHTKDLVNMILYGKVIVWQDLIREGLFIREDDRISEILKLFQRRHYHLALVRDAAERVVGMVTMEDILEEIVGEIHDEHDEGPSPDPRA